MKAKVCQQNPVLRHASKAKHFRSFSFSFVYVYFYRSDLRHVLRPDFVDIL